MPVVCASCQGKRFPGTVSSAGVKREVGALLSRWKSGKDKANTAPATVSERLLNTVLTVFRAGTRVITPLCIRHGKATRILLTSPETGLYRAYELRGVVWVRSSKVCSMRFNGRAFFCPFYVSP